MKALKNMEQFECPDLGALLSGLLDGQVDEETRHQAERHLAGCAACRTHLSRAEELDFLARATLAPADDLLASSLTRMQDAVWTRIGSAQAPAIRIEARRLRLSAWTGWGAALAATVTLAFFLSRPQPSSLAPSNLQAAGSLESSEPEQPDSGADRIALNGSGSKPSGDTLDNPAAHTQTQNQQRLPQARQVSAGALPPGFLPSRAIGRPPFVVVQVNRPQMQPSQQRPMPIDLSRFAATDQSVRIPQWFPVYRDTSAALTAESAASDLLAAHALSAGDHLDTRPLLAPPGADDVIYQATVILRIVRAPDSTLETDLPQIQAAIALDDLPERIASMRDQLASPEDRRIVSELWSLLEWVSATRDDADLSAIRQRLLDSGLVHRAQDLSDRVAHQ